MVKTAEQLVQEMLGAQMVQIARLAAQVEELTARLEAPAKSEKPRPDDIVVPFTKKDGNEAG